MAGNLTINRNGKMIGQIESTPVEYPFRFIIAGDSGASLEPPNPLADTIFSEMLDQMQRIKPAPIFFVHLGDFAGPGTIERHDHYLQMADRLAFPNICVIGNHEHDDPVGLKNFQKIHGSTNFSFAYGHTRFVAIRTHKQQPRGPRVNDLIFLEESLQDDDHPNKIVFMHAPPYLDDHYEPHGDWGFSTGRSEFLTIVKKHNVKLVCCAHFLAYDYHVHNGTSYVVSGCGGWGLCSHFGVCSPKAKPPNRGAFYHFVEVTVQHSGAINGRIIKAFKGTEYEPYYKFEIDTAT